MFSGRLFTSKIRIDECAELLGLKSVPTVKVGPFGTWQEDEDLYIGKMFSEGACAPPYH